jgi:hypothetical protein
VILAHNYQTPEIFHYVADVVGDSLALALAISTEREHVEFGDGRFDFAIRMAAALARPVEWHRLVPVAVMSELVPNSTT